MVAGAIKNLHTSGAIKACPLNCWIFVVFFFLSSRSFFFFFLFFYFYSFWTSAVSDFMPA